MKKSELRQIIREEVKHLTSAMRIREARNEFQVTDFPEGTKILFKDGEEWIVVKPGMRGSSNRRKSDEITIRPFNKLAKDRNISLPIDINLEFLNANTKSISESVNETSEVNERNTKLYVYASSKKDHQMISNWLERSAFHAEEDSNSFMFSVSGQRDADATERDLDKEFTKLGANARFVLEGRSQIKRKQLPAMLPESIGPEAAVIHSMTRAGQDAVMNFIMSNDLSAAKIIDYLKRNPDQRYNVRDLIAGAGVGAQRLYRDKMLKLFR